jgi:hypothetical protein
MARRLLDLIEAEDGAPITERLLADAWLVDDRWIGGGFAGVAVTVDGECFTPRPAIRRLPKEGTDPALPPAERGSRRAPASEQTEERAKNDLEWTEAALKESRREDEAQLARARGGADEAAEEASRTTWLAEARGVAEGEGGTGAIRRAS